MSPRKPSRRPRVSKKPPGARRTRSRRTGTGRVAAGQTGAGQPRRSPGRESLARIVGDDVYEVWVEMLRRLGRDGRSHRLVVLVASMLQHAACVAYDSRERRRKGTPPGDPDLLDALLEPEPKTTQERLAAPLARLFEDAGVPSLRTSRRGDEYGLIEGSIEEFLRWFDMPWEG